MDEKQLELAAEILLYAALSGLRKNHKWF